MLVSAIVAMDCNGLIGSATGLPWHLPKDLGRFRRYTVGKPVIMGRTTHEKIGRPLPDRLNIVLTHDPAYRAAGCTVAPSLEAALSVAGEDVLKSGTEEAMIIGGAKVYAEALHRCNRLYLTLVEGRFEGTTYFPLESLRAFRGRVVHEEVWPADAKNPHRHAFLVIERDRPATSTGTAPGATAGQARLLPEGWDLATLVPWGSNVL